MQCLWSLKKMDMEQVGGVIGQEVSLGRILKISSRQTPAKPNPGLDFISQ